MNRSAIEEEFDSPVQPENGHPVSSLPKPKSARQLMLDYPNLHAPIVSGLLRRGETGNIIAPAKFHKSFAMIDLAIAVATGRMWLGVFQTTKSRVLYIDNELHEPTIANRIPKVAGARGVVLDEYGDDLHFECLRGKLRDIHGIGQYLAQFEYGEFGLIVIDAFYRTLPIGTDENSNSDLTALYNSLDNYAEQLGCAIVCVHHASKGNQTAKAITDVGSGAGAQSRAADLHLVLRSHKEKDCVVMDAAVRSFAPLEPQVLRWTFPVWTPAPDLDPADLKPERLKAAKASKGGDANWTAATFAERFVRVDPRTQSSIVVEAKSEGLSERSVKQLIEAAEDAGKLYRWEPRNKTQPVRFATVAPTLVDVPNTPPTTRKRGAK